MPMINEHSARINEPGKYKEIRRENDKFGKGIDVIWGVLEDGTTEVQAIRFDKIKFSVEECKAWLEKNEYKPIEFEKAKEEETMMAEEKPIWIQVFRTGEHTSKSGQVTNIDSLSLAQIERTYNDKIKRNESYIAPLVKGHPKHDSPAEGWVERLKRVGNNLYAKVKQVNSDFINEVKEGRYKKISISLYPNLMLRHVGFLGGSQPAVKGMELPAFMETYNFTENFNYFNNNKKEIKMTDEEKTQYKAELMNDLDFVQEILDHNGIVLDANESMEERNEKGGKTNYSEKIKKEVEMKTKEFDEYKAKSEIFKIEATTQLKDASEKIEGANKRIAELEDKTYLAEESNFCEGLIRACKVLPKERDVFVKQLVRLRKEPNLMFSETESMYQSFKESLTNRDKIFFGDTIVRPEEKKPFVYNEEMSEDKEFRLQMNEEIKKRMIANKTDYTTELRIMQEDK